VEPERPLVATAITTRKAQCAIPSAEAVTNAHGKASSTAKRDVQPAKLILGYIAALMDTHNLRHAVVDAGQTVGVAKLGAVAVVARAGQTRVVFASLRG